MTLIQTPCAPPYPPCRPKPRSPYPPGLVALPLIPRSPYASSPCRTQLHFHWPESGDSLKDFKDFIYLSQINQAYFYQAQTEHYRRSKTQQPNTMGALYWYALPTSA